MWPINGTWRLGRAEAGWAALQRETESRMQIKSRFKAKRSMDGDKLAAVNVIDC